MSPEPKTSKSRIGRYVWLVIGLVCVGLAGIGVVLPLMPTTVFLLIAAYAFARSSTRLHGWLVTHPVFGPVIRDWYAHRALSRKAKIVSVVSMVAIVALSAIFGLPVWILIIQTVILTTVAAYLVSRPSPPT